MAYNKFITADGLVLLDLTADTVTANKLLKGITTHDRSGQPIIGTVEANSAIPIEVSTEEEMTALLESGKIGGVYKYTGTTGTYENGALYVLEEEAEKTYSLTITNTGNDTDYEWLHYVVDSEDYNATEDTILRAGETITIEGIKSYVCCWASPSFKEESTILNNCTIEWADNMECKIYPTGENATASLEVYD